MNSANLTGRLTKDPELRYGSGSGNARCSFNLAVDKGLSKQKKQEAESKGQLTADFINVIAWGKVAEVISNYVKKGQKILIEGSIRTNSYEKEGKRIITTNVEAKKVEFLEKAAGNNNNNGNNNYGQENQNQGYDPYYEDDIPF